MDPYAAPNETRVGQQRKKIQHKSEDAAYPRTARERQAEKEAVKAERRAIKISARRHLKQQMLRTLEELQ